MASKGEGSRPGLAAWGRVAHWRFYGEEVSDAGWRRDAFEKMRNAVTQDYQVQTGNVWRLRSVSHTSQTGKFTSVAVDARDFMCARQDRKTQEHLPEGTLVAVTGGKDMSQPAAIFQRLDKVRVKYPDMVIFNRRSVGSLPQEGPRAHQLAGPLASFGNARERIRFFYFRDHPWNRPSAESRDHRDVAGLISEGVPLEKNETGSGFTTGGPISPS